MEKILVTGGAGFIGSNFAVYWRKNYPQDRVTLLDAMTYAASPDTLKALHSRQVKFIKGNVCDAKAVAAAIKGQDAVFHFAAESHVDRSILNSQAFLTTNILGTQVLLEAARAAGTGRFVYVSTDEVYGSVAKGFFTESSAIAPNSPYAASKASGDLLARAYWRTYKLPVLTTRCCNNFGPYQFPEKVVPLFVTNLIEGKKIPLYGKGANVREWIYVEDHCRAIDAVYRKGELGEAYNVGTDFELNNLELAHRILDLMGKPKSSIEYVADRPGHDLRYALDSSKIKKLGWKAQYDFERAIRLTIDWYSENLRWWVKLKKGKTYRAYIKKQYK